jgi:hypothetical protein
MFAASLSTVPPSIKPGYEALSQLMKDIVFGLIWLIVLAVVSWRVPEFSMVCYRWICQSLMLITSWTILTPDGAPRPALVDSGSNLNTIPPREGDTKSDRSLGGCKADVSLLGTRLWLEAS